MNAKYLVLAVVCGTLAMFVFKAAWRMAAWPDAAYEKLDDARRDALKEVVPDNGFYVAMDGALICTFRTPGVTNIEEGPMGKTLGIQFVCDLLVAIFLALVVGALPGPAMCRMGIMATAGLGAAFMRDVPLWNWYGFSGLYTTFAVLETVIAFALVGLIAGALHRKCCGGAAAPAPAA